MVQRDFHDSTFAASKLFLIRYKSCDIGTMGVVKKEDHHVLGELYLLPEYQGRSISSFSLNPNLATAYNNSGLVLHRERRYAEAIACYGQALRLNPEDSIARLNSGLALYHDGQPEHAHAEGQRVAACGNPRRAAEARRFLSTHP